MRNPEKKGRIHLVFPAAKLDEVQEVCTLNLTPIPSRERCRDAFCLAVGGHLQKYGVECDDITYEFQPGLKAVELEMSTGPDDPERATLAKGIMEAQQTIRMRHIHKALEIIAENRGME